MGLLCARWGAVLGQISAHAALCGGDGRRTNVEAYKTINGTGKAKNTRKKRTTARYLSFIVKCHVEIRCFQA